MALVLLDQIVELVQELFVHWPEDFGVQDALHLGDHDDRHRNSAVEYAGRIVYDLASQLVFSKDMLRVGRLPTSNPEPEGIENELPFCWSL